MTEVTGAKTDVQFLRIAVGTEPVSVPCSSSAFGVSMIAVEGTAYVGDGNVTVANGVPVLSSEYVWIPARDPSKLFLVSAETASVAVIVH